MRSADFEGVILDSDNFEGEINHIGVSHERTRQPDGSITEEGHSISHSESGELMWVARIALPGAIYDASAAAQTFREGGRSMFWKRKKTFRKMGKRRFLDRKENDFEHIPGFQNLHMRAKGCYASESVKGNKKNGPVEYTFYGAKYFISKRRFAT